MKTILSAWLMFPLWAMAADVPTPLAHWNFVEEDSWRRPVSGGMTLQTGEGVSRVADARFDAAVTIAGGLTLPGNLVDRIRDEGTVSFWLYTERSPGDATHQPLIQSGARPLARELRLRWNRFFVYENVSPILDTLPAGNLASSLDEEIWTPVAFSWKGGEGEVMLRGVSIGRFKLGQGRFVQENLTIGSAPFQGKLTHLRVYDRALAPEQANAVAALNIPQDVPGEDDPAPNCPGETLGQVKRRSGYTIQEMKEWFPAIEDWPDYEPLSRLAPSYAQERFKAPPPPGVHPRVLFNPEDLPGLRKRMSQTAMGRRMIQGIRGRCLQLAPTPEAWEEHLQGPEVEKHRADYAARGIEVTRRMGFHGPWMGGWLNDLARGEVTPEIREDIAKPQHVRHFRFLMHQLPYEAFRALLDEDDEALTRVGRAIGTLARYWRADPEIQQLAKGTSWQAIYQRIHSEAIGLAYDFAYPVMTERDRKDVRAFISMVTTNKEILPFQALPALPGNTTNWLGIHTNMLPMVLAIQGEEGYDELSYRKIAAAQKKWVYIANGPLGAPFEGFRKSGYMPWWLVYLAKQGEPLIGTERALNVYRQYSLHTMVPWGGSHIYETEIGPVDGGVPYLKYAHPEDPVVDMLYGAHVRKFLEDGQVYWPNIRTTYPPLYVDLFVAQDPAGVAPDGRYDWEATLDRTLAHLKAIDEPLRYYSDYRGVMTARSSWDRDAVLFYMEPRNVPGGHTHGSRNEFLVVGLGREWSTRHKSVEAPSTWHSVMLVDGKGQGWEVGKCPAGRTLAFEDSDTATFLAGDATWAYRYGLVNMPGGGSEPVPVTPNDSRLEKSPLPWMDVAWANLPQWFTGGKPGRKYQSGHGHWKTFNPVEYAFRTGGLMRGKYPYALVVDDFKKDDEVRAYTWQMQLAADLQVEKQLEHGMLDLTLVEDGPRRCLVRVVEAGGQAVDAATANASGQHPFAYTDRYGKPQANNRLVVETRAANGHTVALVYPYRPGMPQMKTEWNQDRTELTVTLDDQVDVFTLVPQADGRRQLVHVRKNG